MGQGEKMIVLENIRSAYNTGNIIRTADALRCSVMLTGYTPSPFEDEKVKKTSLGSEHTVPLSQERNPKKALETLKGKGYFLVAAETTEGAIPLQLLDDLIRKEGYEKIAIIFGNEATGVLPESLELCDIIVSIPMKGMKESLNVGQAAAIVMRELSRNITL